MEPHVYTSLEEIWTSDRFPFPDLSENPSVEGWEQIGDAWFIDHSGFGRKDEPALTLDQFRVKLAMYVAEHPDHGFAITDVGQFQLYVSVYRKKFAFPRSMMYTAYRKDDAI